MFQEISSMAPAMPRFPVWLGDYCMPDEAGTPLRCLDGKTSYVVQVGWYLIGSMGRLHIYLHEWLILMVNVCKYTIPMGIGWLTVDIVWHCTTWSSSTKLYRWKDSQKDDNSCFYFENSCCCSRLPSTTFQGLFPTRFFFNRFFTNPGEQCFWTSIHPFCRLMFEP